MIGLPKAFAAAALLGLLLAGPAGSEEDPAASRAAAEPKPDSVTKHGVLAEKPLNAAEGVAAILTVTSDAKLKDQEERRERKRQIATAGASAKYDLVATGEVAAKLLTLARRGATVYVTGSLSGATLKVTEVREPGEDGPREARERREKQDKRDKRDRRERLERDDKQRDTKPLL